MTLRRAEAITGLRIEIRLDPEDGETGLYEACGYDNGTCRVRVFSRDGDSRLLKDLVDENLRLMRRQVIREQAGRCAVCAKFWGQELQVDHIVRRSKNRDDRRANLQGLCPSYAGCGFHRRKHGG